MRQYQVQVTLNLPVLLSYADKPDDPEAMFRFLNDALTFASLEFQQRTPMLAELLKESAIEAGIALEVPDAAMGSGLSISDVTGQVGKRWTKKQ